MKGIDPNIVIAIISGLFMIIATAMTVHSGNTKTQALIEKNQAVSDVNMRALIEKNQALTDEKIGELTREVREHNNFAKRVPVIEQRIDTLEARVDKLEAK